MLWALLAFYLFGGGGLAGGILSPAVVDQISEQVEVIVTDSVRSEAARQTLGELKDEVKNFDKRLAKAAKELRKQYKDHGADVTRMLAVVDEFDADWQTAQMRAIELRFVLKASLTAEEWAVLFGSE